MTEIPQENQGKDLVDETLRQAMLEQVEEGRLSCARAHVLAEQLGIDPWLVGQAANEAGVRISHCLLGLFGYGPKAEGRHKIIQPMDAVPEGLAARLRALAEGGAISCAAVWRVATEFGIGRLKAASAVEALGLRVSVCQLGCFPRR